MFGADKISEKNTKNFLASSITSGLCLALIKVARKIQQIFSRLESPQNMFLVAQSLLLHAQSSQEVTYDS